MKKNLSFSLSNSNAVFTGLSCNMDCQSQLHQFSFYFIIKKKGSGDLTIIRSNSNVINRMDGDDAS
jgi:hypothetical protein